MRRIEVTALYVRATTRHGIVAGSDVAKRIAREIRALAEGSLPADGDVDVVLPPAERVWQHAVRETGYLVLYGFDDERLVLRTLRIVGG